MEQVQEDSVEVNQISLGEEYALEKKINQKMNDLIEDKVQILRKDFYKFEND